MNKVIKSTYVVYVENQHPDPDRYFYYTGKIDKRWASKFGSAIQFKTVKAVDRIHGILSKDLDVKILKVSTTIETIDI